MHVVLVEPEIPPNTGNIARLCAATNTTLHLVEPFGFKLDDARLRRAGMDYWRQVNWHRWPDWRAFEAKAAESQIHAPRFWFVEQGGGKIYSDVKYGAADYLVFGRETAGLPAALLEKHRDTWIRIPMFNSQSRSLNVSNCVGIVLFEALRQQGFAGEI